MPLSPLASFDFAAECLHHFLLRNYTYENISYTTPGEYVTPRDGSTLITPLPTKPKQRLDYFFLTISLLRNLRRGTNPPDYLDHAPVTIDLEIDTMRSCRCHWQFNEFLLKLPEIELHRPYHDIFRKMKPPSRIMQCCGVHHIQR